MSPAERAFVSRLRRRASAMAPETARRYLEAYRLIREVLPEAELARAIATGQLESLLAEVIEGEASDPVFRRLRLRLDEVLIDVARAETGQMPSFLRVGIFDTLNPAVVTAAREFDASALATLRAEVADLIRQEAVAGIEAGLNPRTVARKVRGTIGLSPQQAAWVRNFREELERGDRAALRRVLAKGQIRTPDGSRIIRPGHASGEGLTKAQMATLDRLLGTGPIPQAQIDAMVSAYEKRLLALNVEAHTKTQMLQAQKLGQRASWEDAIARGVVPREALKRRWLTTLDGRERPEHHAMNGETVGFDERFSNGQLVPGEDEYNCRCLSRVFVDVRAMASAA